MPIAAATATTAASRMNVRPDMDDLPCSCRAHLPAAVTARFYELGGAVTVTVEVTVTVVGGEVTVEVVVVV